MRTTARLLCSLVLFAALALVQKASAAASATNIFYFATTPVVDSIGGGPIPGKFTAANGFHDGNTFNAAQFDGPMGMAIDSQNNLYIADKNNNAVRQVSLAGDTANSITTTWLTNLSQVVAVAEDPSDNLYIVTKGTNAIPPTLWKYNRFKNLIYTNALPMTNPTGMALQLSAPTNIFITFTNGLLLNLVQSSDGTGLIATNTVVDTNFNWRPAGIAVRLSGQLVVSDLAQNAIYTVNNATNTTPTFLVGGTPGWVDGARNFVQFNQPYGVALAANDDIIVADLGNNAIRLIDTNLNVFTVYGTTSNFWGAQFPAFPGWLDGTPGNSKTNAVGRQPFGVALSTSGLLFVTDLKYDVLRDVTGLGLVGITAGGGTSTGGGGGGGTNIQPPTVPTINPSSGFFAQCQNITVSNSFGSVFFTTDGSDPTTNSTPVLMANGVGTILWCNPTEDLSSLRVKAFNQGVSSATVSGTPPVANQIGFTGTTYGGIGATVVIPVSMNLLPGVSVKSLQYRVQITPNGTNTHLPVINLLTPSSQDFIVYAGADTAGVTNIRYSVTNVFTNVFTNYVTTNVVISGVTNVFVTNITAVTNIGTNVSVGFVVAALANTSTLNAQNFAVVGLLAVTVPAACTEGQSFKLEVLYPSGTSDAQQTVVSFAPMTNLFPILATNFVQVLISNGPGNFSTNFTTNVVATFATNLFQSLVVSNITYYAGDSSPGHGYNAGEFGGQRLNNADVNNALYASAGIRVPFAFSDVFNAMDVYPQSAGLSGDGLLSYLDWSTILLRSEFIDTNVWARSWSVGGILLSTQTNSIPGFAPSSAPKTPPPGQVWLSQAQFSSATITNAIPGSVYSLPVYMNILPGYALSGYQFRATLKADGNAPAAGTISFTGSWLAGPTANDIVCYANLGSVSLQGNNLAGYIMFQVPANAVAGQSYTLHFSYVDGAPDLNTQYHLESLPGSVWVLAAAGRPAPVISDEWKIKFFGSTTNPLAADNADPDGDGQSNLQEYLAGTDPTKANSRLQFTGVHSGLGAGRTVALDWLTAPSKNYLLQSAPSLDSTNWTTEGTYTGDGFTQESIQNNNSGNARFYRLRLQP